jgi:hypothetical protein
VHELVLLANEDVVETFQPILYGSTFTIVTYNKLLSYFMIHTTMGERSTRWKMFQQSFDFTIIHTAGKNNILVNTLSRIYEERTANAEEEIMEDP